jgi:hypothetical protein
VVRWLRWPFLFVLAAFDRATPLGRLVLLPYAVWCCAVSWPMIGLALHKGDRADKNALARYWWGFAAPTLKWDTEGSASHRAIDFLVEWVRASPQRAAKLGSFVILLLATLAALGWLL